MKEFFVHVMAHCRCALLVPNDLGQDLGTLCHITSQTGSHFPLLRKFASSAHSRLYSLNKVLPFLSHLLKMC